MTKTLTKPFHVLTVDDKQTIHILNEHYQSIHECKCPLPLSKEIIFPVFECDFIVMSQTDNRIWFWHAYRQQGTLLTLPGSLMQTEGKSEVGITTVNDTQFAIIKFHDYPELYICNPFQQTWDEIELDYRYVFQMINLIDGRLAITDLEYIYVWDLAQKRCELTLTMHQTISGCGMIRLNGNQIATGHENGDVVVWTIIRTSFSYYRLHTLTSPIASLLKWSDNQLIAHSPPVICKFDLRSCYNTKVIDGNTLIAVRQVTHRGKPVIYYDNGRDIDVRDEYFNHYFHQFARILDQLPDERLVVSLGPNDVRIVNIRDKSLMGLVNTCLASFAHTRQDVEAFHKQLDEFLSPYLLPDLYDIIGRFLSEKLCNLS